MKTLRVLFYIALTVLAGYIAFYNYTTEEEKDTSVEVRLEKLEKKTKDLEWKNLHLNRYVGSLEKALLEEKPEAIKHNRSCVKCSSKKLEKSSLSDSSFEIYNCLKCGTKSAFYPEKK